MSQAPHVDNQLTADRRELKFRVPPTGARLLARVLSERLPQHRFTGPGANALPGARHFVTTVYFDTADFELYQAARTCEGSLKVRAKEYYDENLALTELVRTRAALVHSSPILWVELKESVTGRSRKRRIGIPKHEVARFFATGQITEQMLEIQRRTYATASQEVLDALVEVCRRFTTPLCPSVVVNYRRTAWQDEDESLRVTIDRDLAFFAAAANTWPHSPRLERQHLGPKLGWDPLYIVEVKCLGGLPPWLQEALDTHAGELARTSKFLAASEAMLRAQNHKDP
ncbi:polyphosphate polymerase domain-containing protein [Paraliomyxa miuraensis]|uniref:polyphosphate polymerase domain-containing protein n=1 Tax=Paraliomyxa miuraensis TaxID=376150 RepID=UPI00224DF349|nr:polyphosphate polymerase domain-containing protein [Paraliomyxa miuraensis]MCX4245308.1 polyphosphate polymerase domain-containing protein [Paraliomyxa miuraensis]